MLKIENEAGCPKFIYHSMTIILSLFSCWNITAELSSDTMVGFDNWLRIFVHMMTLTPKFQLMTIGLELFSKE